MKAKELLLSDDAELINLGITIANDLPKNDKGDFYKELCAINNRLPFKFKKNKFRK